MKVVFLDIDGVLQPLGMQNRFNHMKEIPDLCQELNHTLKNDFDYVAFLEESSLNAYDIAAVYYDWDKLSVEYLRHILDSTGAKIVLSSDWRERDMKNMRGLLGIHHLDTYLADATYFVSFYERYQANDKSIGKDKVEAWVPIIQTLIRKMREIYPSEGEGWSQIFVTERAAEIREYLDRHPEITSFVAIDDRNIEKGLLGRFIKTDNKLSNENMEKCINLLNNEDGPFFLEEFLKSDNLQTWRKKYVYPYFPKVI